MSEEYRPQRIEAQQEKGAGKGMEQTSATGHSATQSLAVGTVDSHPHPIDLLRPMPRVPSRAEIEMLEREMLKRPQLAIKTTHHFFEGGYAREIFIPAGTLLTGKVHSGEHLNIVSLGEITVWTEDGMKTVCAPFTMVSRPGTKRVGLAIKDTVWTTIHANPINTRDLARLESLLIATPQLAHAADCKVIDTEAPK